MMAVDFHQGVKSKMSLSSTQIVIALWAIVTACYVVIMVFRSIVGQKEDDSLFLSAGEARMEAQQHEVVKRITKLDVYSHWVGAVALTFTVILVGMWLYSVLKNLHIV
jgi:hypothetical protein